ncbi:MAG: 4'-phosphopantetheinyl transferase superfamily protein [Firmicutes bacterium]|nr:4'-phosphopantetheinyl transferase superfamily protein [Bacillota bacterium]
MEVYAVKLSEGVSRDELERVCANLPEERQNKIRAYTRFEDSLRSAAAGLLLQRLAAERIQVPSGRPTWSRDQHGKPFLPGADGFHFNLSHSGEWVAAVIDRTPVGIDIERVRPIDLKLARDSFTASEYRELVLSPAAERESYFFQFWTLKESYLKLLGTGLSRTLDSFTVAIEPGGSASLDDPQGHERAYFKRYDVDPRYRLSVCARHGGFPAAVSLLDWDSLTRD